MTLLYKTDGVILRVRNIGEADRIVTIYTHDHGKVRASARGARRPRSRFLGPTQLFTHGRFLVFRGSGLDTLSQVDIVHSNQLLRESLDTMASGMYVVELLDELVEEGEPHPDIFDLLLTVLDLITKGRAGFALRLWELRLMGFLGYEPQLSQCLGCGEKPEKAAYFTVEGGLSCETCRRQFKQVLPIQPGTIQWMERMLQWDLSRISILHPSAPSLAALEALLGAYVGYRLERPLKSAAFLASLAHPPNDAGREAAKPPDPGSRSDPDPPAV